MVTGMILPDEHFSNIVIDNGKVVSDGSRNIVIGVAMPGLKESLNLSKDQEKDITLIGKCESITMIGSDVLIYRLVYNLVENAIRYNHPGGQVTVTACRKEQKVYLSVADTGSGIPEDLRERVFEPFFRVDKSRSRELGGVGLGLALAREIVRVHEGSITVRSNPSGGTIFDVTFTQGSI